MILRIKLSCTFALLSAGLFAQKPVYLQSFEPATSYSTTKGISGTALDLSANASIRKILTVKNPLNSSDFSVMIWVKASPDLGSDYDVFSSTNQTDKKLKGWRLGVQANGAWRWEAYGKSRYEYNPTVERQTVKDNRWHLLAFTYAKEKEEVRLYYDGINTAIYYCPGLDSLNSEELFIGGRIADPTNSSSAEYRDQWHAFNGALDQAALFGEVLNADFIHKQYKAYFPSLNKKENQSAGEKKLLKVMNFNIFHGGNETGKEVGVTRIVEVIKNSGADVISMQETYGSGARIADKLGYYLYLRSTNISIMSRYPIEETLNGYKSFYNGGAHIRLSKNQKISFFANWLNFPTDYWGDLEQHKQLNADTLRNQMDKGNTGDLRNILDIIKPYTDQAEQVPVIFCGDFNSGSHLDWIESTKHLNGGLVVPFPSGILLLKNGFKDSFREIHPDPLKVRGITWSPMSVQAFKDRIDYIYYKGSKIKAIASGTIDRHPVKYPSDHAALLTVFKLQE